MEVAAPVIISTSQAWRCREMEGLKGQVPIELVPFKELPQKPYLGLLLTFHWPEMYHMTVPNCKRNIVF